MISEKIPCVCNKINNYNYCKDCKESWCYSKDCGTPLIEIGFSSICIDCSYHDNYKIMLKYDKDDKMCFAKNLIIII